MYALIRQILIAFILIAITFESQCEIRRYRLNHVLERVALSSEYQSQAEKDLIRFFDVECAKNFLNLPQNNKILINDYEVVIFVTSTLLKCSDAEKTFDVMIAKNYILSHFKEQLSCLKWQLQKYEPASKLVENYVSSETDAKECGEEFILEKGRKKFQNALELMLGPLNIYTCGAIGEDIKEVLLFIIKGTLIKFDNISDELRKSEKEMLMEQLKDIAFKTVDCVIKRFEHDPQAYLVNDTLNFYYNKEITPTVSNEEDPSEIDKKLIKLESTIDKNCVKEKLNLPENGEKALLNVEASIIIASAKSKCIKVDPIEFSDLFLDYAIADFYRRDPQYSCARNKLHKLEPTSKLAKITGLSEYNHDFCSERGITIEPYSLSFDYNSTVGKLSTSTCGVFTDDILSTIELKTFLLTDEKDKDLKINETRDLFEFVTYKLQKLADCILGRI